MPDPLAFLPLALAAGEGQIDSQPAGALVAAGHALLQRSAVLVRALSGKRSAILLPPGGAFLTALAASDGRGALLIDPVPTESAMGRLDQLFSVERVGAVFTTRSMADYVPRSVVTVCLDETPRRATVRTVDGERVIDLGSHFGLDLAGDRDADGSGEECLMVDGQWFTHHELLQGARQQAVVEGITPKQAISLMRTWSIHSVLRFAAVLLQGGRIVTPDGGGGG